MEIEKIEGYVDTLLESWAVFDEGDEREVYAVMRHALMAWAHYELMSDAHRALVTALMKKVQIYFETKCMLKERKRKTTKEKFPLKPLQKEKEKKDIEKKAHTYVCDAKEAFRQECLGFIDKYDKQLVTDFYYYWSEENPKTGKMLFEEKKHWNTKNRLERWVKNPISSASLAAAERLKKTRGKQVKEGDEAQKSKELAAQREEANTRLEAQIEQSKAGAVSREEWLAMKAAREKTTDDTD